MKFKAGYYCGVQLMEKLGQITFQELVMGAVAMPSSHW